MTGHTDMTCLYWRSQDMEAVQEAGNNFVLWQLMAYFLFDLCGIMQSDVSVEGTLEVMFGRAHPPFMTPFHFSPSLLVLWASLQGVSHCSHLPLPHRVCTESWGSHRCSLTWWPPPFAMPPPLWWSRKCLMGSLWYDSPLPWSSLHV